MGVNLGKWVADRLEPAAAADGHGLAYWRERILLALLVSGLGVGLPVMVYSVRMAIASDLWALALADTLLYLCGAVLLFTRSFSYRLRAAAVLGIVYSLGLWVILSVGVLSGGPAFLFCFAVLAGVLLGLWAALGALVLNVLTLVGIGFLYYAGVLGADLPFFVSLERALVAGANYIVLTAMTAISVAALMEGLEAAAHKEKSATDLLKQERRELIAARDRLQAEIDTRQSAETALREKDDTLKSIFRSAPVGIGLVSGRVLKGANDRLCEMIGFSQKELVGQSARLLYPDEAEFEWVGREKYHQIKKFGTGTVETRWRHKSGRILDVLLSSTPIDASDLSAGVTFSALDITERKRAENALRESENRFRELAELLPETIFEMDMEGRLLFVNRSAFTQFKITQEDFDRGINGLDIIDPSDRDRALESIARIMQGEPSGLNEFSARRTDGSVFPAIIHASPIFRDGEPVGLRGSVIDITHNKRLEAQFHQAQRMESVGTLAGGMAHDFNNLLMGIQGRTSLMMIDMKKGHPFREHLEGIEAYVKSASDLTRQLLGFARAGKYEVKATDVNHLVEKATDMFGRTRKEIQVHTKYAESIWTVEVDRGQIEQVLLNLYVNAWQAMPGGGHLYIETENVTLDEAAVRPFSLNPGRYAKISVTDTGVGIDADAMGRIFDPFFSTKGRGRGTGLGLASAYGIIKNHQGIIDVHSRPGKGATFFIYLPASEKQVTEEPAGLSDVRTGSESILVVDDEGMILDVAEKMLEKLGYRVITATNGPDAIRIYREKTGEIALVILDMVMPEMSGRETFDGIMEINPAVKVLLSSGYSLDGHAEEVMRRGCGSFIQKPFDIQSLSRKVREILDPETSRPADSKPLPPGGG